METTKEYIEMYRRTLKRAVRKVWWIQWTLGFERFERTFRALDNKLEKLEDEMYARGASREELCSPKMQALREYFFRIGAKKQARVFGYD